MAVCLFFSSIHQISAQEKSTKVNIPDNADFWSEYPNEELSEFLISKMTDEELLAQILMFGWAGEEPSYLLNQWISRRGLGSVKVFGWNTDDTDKVAKSIKEVQELAQKHPLKIPLFVATDQEGGWIRHVKGDTTETPGNMAIGASRLPQDAYLSSYYISREINALGINMNFAPTVDLYTNINSSVIGSRSFGENPDFVGKLGSEFVRGSLDAGVIPTAKHFPGHGDTSLDSHGKLPEINADYETLLKRELVPFKYLIKENIPAIMSGHLSFPKIMSNGEPASLSKKFLTDILRNELKYEGLIITDDMMMNGATMYAGSVSAAFTMAIEAGNDIILSSTTAELNENLWTKNIALMKSDKNFEKIVRAAVKKVLLAKLRYFKSKNAAPLYPDLKTVHERVPDKEGEKFFLSQACRSVTAYKSENLPYKRKTNERILLVGQEEFKDFFNEAKKRYGDDCAKLPFPYELGPIRTDWTGNKLESLVSGYDTIICCVANERSAEIAKRLKKYPEKNVIILSVLTPVPVLNFKWADTVLFGYSFSRASFKALFGALNGEYVPKGEIPLSNY